MSRTNQHNSILEVTHAARQISSDAEGRTAHFVFSTKQQLKSGKARRTQSGGSTVHVAILAEDVGRGQDGTAACELVVEQMYGAISVSTHEPLSTRLAQGMHRANAELYTTAQTPTISADARVSIVVAAIVNDELRLAHLGNSRAYLIRRGEAHLLTVDHTWAQEMISSGQFLLTDTENPASQDDVTRCLGIDENVEVDHSILQPYDGKVSAKALPLPRLLEHLTLQPNDVIALCSNGISDTLTEAEIAAAIEVMALMPTAGAEADDVDDSSTLTQAAQRLVQAVDDAVATEAVALLLRVPSSGTATSENSKVIWGWTALVTMLLAAALVILMVRSYQLWSILSDNQTQTPPTLNEQYPDFLATLQSSIAATSEAMSQLTPTTNPSSIQTPTISLTMTPITITTPTTRAPIQQEGLSTTIPITAPSLATPVQQSVPITRPALVTGTAQTPTPTIDLRATATAWRLQRTSEGVDIPTPVATSTPTPLPTVSPTVTTTVTATASSPSQR